MVFAWFVEAVNGVICEVVILLIIVWCGSYLVSYRLRLSATCGMVCANALFIYSLRSYTV